MISGGVKLTGWTQVDMAKHIWSAPAPTTLDTLDTRQLYVNGTWATRASGALPVKITQTATGYTTASGNPMANWRNRSNIEFVYRGGLGLWTEPRCPVASITSTAITMGQPCWNNSTKRVMRPDDSGRTYELVGRQSITESPIAVENAYELLDTADEFYLDKSEHTVYYIPRAGQNLATADVEAPAIQTLLTTSGGPSAPVTGIGFQGIQFSYANYTVPNGGTGFSEIQATYTVTGTKGYAVQGLCSFVAGGTCPYANWTKQPAAVSVTYNSSLHFDHDCFVHLGGAGLDLGNGSQRDTVTACVFTDISGNGLDVGGVDIPQPTKALGSSLMAFEIGNEPSIYLTETAYESAYETYVAAITAKLRGAVFDGPGQADSTSWVSAFGAKEKSNALTIMSTHQYIGSNTTGTIAGMLAANASGRLPKAEIAMEKAQTATGISQWRMTEANSYYHGGTAGVSNVEASSLWSLDFMAGIAAHHGNGVNFHGGISTQFSLSYSPIAFDGLTPTGVQGVYYGELLWTLAGTGAYRSAAVTGGSAVAGEDVTAWGIGNNVFVNNKGASPITATITLASSATKAKEYVLTASSLTSTAITIAGSRVSSAATFTPAPQSVKVDGKKVVVTVPAHSAALL